MKSWFIYLKLHLRRSHHLDGSNQQFFVTIIYQSQQFPFTYSFQKKNLFQTFKWVMYDWNFWIKCKINKQQVTMDPPGSNTNPIRKNQAMKQKKKKHINVLPKNVFDNVSVWKWISETSTSIKITITRWSKNAAWSDRSTVVWLLWCDYCNFDYCKFGM